jgi:hypothetical protein
MEALLELFTRGGVGVFYFAASLMSFIALSIGLARGLRARRRNEIVPRRLVAMISGMLFQTIFFLLLGGLVLAIPGRLWLPGQPLAAMFVIGLFAIIVLCGGLFVGVNALAERFFEVEPNPDRGRWQQTPAQVVCLATGFTVLMPFFEIAGLHRPWNVAGRIIALAGLALLWWVSRDRLGKMKTSAGRRS